MEKVKELYEYIQNQPSGKVYKMNFEPLLDKLMEGFKNAAIELGLENEVEIDSIFDDITSKKEISDKEEIEFSENTHLNNAYKIKALDIKDGDIKQVDKYIYGYKDFTYEEFCSYLYWRYCIRQEKACETPIAFLCMYLIELCNFIEFEDFENTYKKLKYLEKIQENSKAKIKVGEAIMEFLIIYGTKDMAKEYLEKFDYFSYIKDEIQLRLNLENHIFDYIMNHSTHKLKQSSIFYEAPKSTEKWFVKFFINEISLLKEKGINLLELWLGKFTYYDLRFSYVIKEVKNELLIEKEFEDNGYLIMDIKKDGLKVLNKEFCGHEIDPGSCIFGRSYIVTFLVKAFENELRRQLGMRQIKVSTNEISNMLVRVSDRNDNYYALNEIINFYESTEFDICLKKSLDGFVRDFEDEKSNENTKQITYCSVKFEGKNFKYSYLLDDESIDVGDSVLVPVGPYNVESVAVVCEKTNYTESNAPFPIEKTKKIIGKVR